MSYSHVDLSVARHLDAVLTALGMDVWRDERMSPGIRFEGEIQAQLRNSEVCLFLLSKSFLSSEYCQNEVGYAEACGISFLPCRLDDCKPTGFLTSRNYLNLTDTQENPGLDDRGPRGYLDYEEIMEHLRRPSLVSMLDGLIRRSRQEILRAELVDFYERSLYLAGSSETSGTHSLRFTSGDCSTEQMLEESREDFEVVVRSILSYLKDGEPLDGLPRAMSFEWQRDYQLIPAWRLRSSSLAQINAGTQFQALPDCYLGYSSSHEQGNLIEASVDILMESNSQQGSGQHQNGSEQVGYLEMLSPTTMYGFAGAENLMKLGWGCQEAGQQELVLIPLKGIYRIARVTMDEGITRVTFTKYVGIEATRAKLGIGRAGKWAETRGDTFDVQDIISRSALELMYLGEDVTADRRHGVSFLLFNNYESIAIVRSMRVRIHRITPIPPESGDGIPYGIFKEYRYAVKLPLKEGDIPVTEDNFKYSPGEVDSFTVQLIETMRGYTYEISVLIEWMDITDGRLTTIETPKEVVRFPRYGG